MYNKPDLHIFDKEIKELQLLEKVLQALLMTEELKYKETKNKIH